ncbi:thrombospondin type 3 repeat-containing protein [Flavobacteriaceae bacterium]|nr:thrombospondin type 3 repeat-containing protein [Flavobacteriaceae bacterium]
MSATASDSVWTYTWTVSGTTVTSTTATVSATDLSGNAYSGTESITFTIDNTASSGSATLGVEKIRVVSVTSSSLKKTYRIGEQIEIEVGFTGNVSVTGSPYLEFSTGWRVGRALYNRGSGTSTLTFEYTVNEFDEVENLSYINQNSLIQSGRLVPWGSNYSGGEFTVGAQYNGYDNNVVTGLNSNVLQVYSLGNEGESTGFAAYKKDNSFITWGSPDVGALYPNTSTQYKENIGTIGSQVLQNYLDGNIIDVTTTWRSLAILKTDGSVSTWGDCDCSDLFTWNITTSSSSTTSSGSVSTTNYSIVNTDIGNKLQSDVLKVYASRTSFAALKNDGTVVTWGNPRAGGLGDGVNDSNYSMDENTPINEIKNVKSLHTSDRAIAALKYDGSVVTWGGVGDGFDNKSGGDSSSVSSSLTSSVSQVFSTGRAFAALKSDGSVITWGGDDYGGDSSAVSSQLQSNVIHIFTTKFAFAALKSNGSLVVWGNSTYGPGDSSLVSSQLQSGVIDVQSTEGAFAALKSDGSIVVWGRSGWGNDLGNISNSNFKKVIGNQSAFSGLKNDGSVVSWGTVNSAGGDNSLVSTDISSNVIDVFSTSYSFSALRNDGSIVTWGSLSNNSLVNADVFSKIYSNSSAYVGLVGEDILDTNGNIVITSLERKNGKQPYLIDSEISLDGKSPTVELLVDDNIVSPSSVTTITAIFSEALVSSPTINLTSEFSEQPMSYSGETNKWFFEYTPSSSVTSTTATVSGTDLSGNAYTGTDSITFTIDNSNPSLVSFTDNDANNIVNNSTNVTLTATFSEPMIASPTISISGLVTNTAMTVSASTNSTTWTYFWDVPSGSDGTYFATVSGTDLLGNSYTGTESITFVVDNTAPLIQSVTVTNTNSKVLLTYNEPVQLYDPSYFASNFSVTKTGGTATVSYTGYSFSTTDSNTVILNIIVTGEPTGDELLEVGPVGASTLIDKAGNYAMDYSDSNQTSNTVYLTNTPPKFASTSVSSNNTSITIAFSEGVTADTSGTELSKTDFTLAVIRGTAVLESTTPIALSKTDSKTYVLTTSYSVPSNGSEILTVTPISSAVFDSKGTQINLSSAQSNTVQLNDQAGPFITGATLDSQNRYVDFTFSEGVYATASPTSAVTSSSFTLSQSSGPSYGMTISSITTAGGGVLSGGETTLRFNLESAVKPTGQEVFAITATDSSSVVDASGNSMTVSQTNNTFQLKPPTSGGVSPKKSTISAAPAQMIGNGINTAVITVQAKDSLGQNFLEGGYQITLFGPNGDLTTTDNQNGTYSASYTPEAITQDFQELTFGFRVADTNGTPTALLQLYLDEDGDGVYNINDACLGTEAGLEVDATGCALNQLDSDNDGVFDDLDECPDTPEQELNNVQGTPTYGELIPTVVDEKGCGASQRDTDSDGIVDTEDNCIETANADQADTDGDGIGDVCDTDNPLPEITTTEIKFVQLPQNGTTVGKIEATDPDGETLTFTQSGDNFTGVLSIASDGSITVSSGALLTFDSTYNGASLGFTVSDGKNDVPGSVKILIEDVPRPPEISIITLEISEDAEVGTIVGFVEAKDPMGGQIVSISLQGDGFIELKDGVLKTTQELDYEENTIHPFTITAQASDRSDGPGLTGSKSESLRVSDIPNATYTGRFFISIFNVVDETLGAKVDHRRYFNPYNKNVGKWKIKKRVAGGADADKFTIKTRSKTEQKNGDPIEDENEDYLDFITPPDYENPGDANGDNIYEVEVEYVNTDDGAPEVPIVVTQTNIQVPEGSTTTIELQSQPVLPTDDNDGDGVPDIIDNSPLVANADQSDEDGDGVGDVTDDSDHDGVWNPFDTCPDTPLGELVDLDGCLIYYLPASNFSISKTEKCIGENSITIDVIDATLDYNVTVSGATNATEVFTGSSWSLENLSAGEYTLCIGVEGVNPSEFERCFEVTIEESDPLLVSSFYSKENQNVTFDLSGGSAYQITHNGKTIQTSSSKHTVQLDKGINNISISTGIECQGLFEKTYLNSYEVKYAPNPFKEELQLFIGGKDNLVEIGVYASNGQLIDYQTVSLSFGMRNYSLNTSSYKQGVYIIKVKGQTLDQSIQVIKE